MTSNNRHGVSTYRSIECLFNPLVRLTTLEHQRSSALLALCEGNPPVNGTPVNGGFPSQRFSKAENVSIWWRHNVERHCVTSTETEMSIWYFRHWVNQTLPKWQFSVQVVTKISSNWRHSVSVKSPAIRRFAQHSLFRRTMMKHRISSLEALCEGNQSVMGGFP